MPDIASLSFKIDSSGLTKSTRELDAMRRAGTKAETSADKLKAAQKRLGDESRRAAGGSRLLAAGLGLVSASLVSLAFKRAIDGARQFRIAMAEVSTLVDTAVVSIKTLSRAALDQARSFASTATDQVGAIYQIISAGASTAAAAIETLTAANVLAVGGVTSIGTAADGLTSILNAYGDQVENATAVSDAMFVAVVAGKTDINQLSRSLGLVAPLAAQVGVSFDELAASIAALTKGGIRTRVAVSGVRAILATIVLPAEQAAQLAEKLGLEFNSTALKAKGLAGFLEDVFEATGRNVDAIGLLFPNVEALVPVLSFAGQAGNDLADTMQVMAIKAGSSREAFEKLAGETAFQLNVIFGSLVISATELGNAFLVSLAPAIKRTSEVLQGLERWPPLVETVFKTLTVAIAAFAVVTIGKLILAAAIASKTLIAFTVAVAAVGPVAALSAVGVSAFGAAVRLALGPVGALITVVYLLTDAWVDHGRRQAEAADETAAHNVLLEENTALLAKTAAFTREGAESKISELETLSTQLEAEQRAIQVQRDALENTPLNQNVRGRSRFLELQKQGAELVKLDERLASIGEGIGLNLALRSEIQEQITGFVKEEEVSAERLAEIKRFVDQIRGGDESETEKSLSNEAKLLASNTLAANQYIDALRVQITESGLSGSRQELLAGERAATELRAQGLEDEAELTIALTKVIADRIGAAEEQASQQDANRRGIQLQTEFLNTQLNALDDYISSVREAQFETSAAAFGIADSFGSVGESVAQVVLGLTEYRAQIREIEATRIRDDFLDPTKQAENAARAAQRTAQVQVRTYADLTSAAKSFFDQGSKGFKTLETAERAYRLVELALALKSLLVKTSSVAIGTSVVLTGAAIEAKAVSSAEALKTSSTVVGAATRTPLKVAEGAASMFAALGPFGFGAVAAMLGVLASLGFRSAGGGSGVAVSEERQRVQGAGSVLGDEEAKSASISKSLELVAANTNTELEYSNSQLRALRSIDLNISSLTNLLARQLGVGGVFNTDNLGLGSVKSGGLLSSLPLIGGLFGRKTTRTLADQGLSFGPQSLSDISGGGLRGESFQTVATQTKKKIFGITTSNRTATDTESTALEGQILAEMERIIGSLREGVLLAAGSIGADGASAALDAFSVNLGTISLKGLTGPEIQEALSGIFGKLGDELAAAAIPTIAALQRVGEGSFETLIRVARQYQVIDTTLESIGLTFEEVGIASLGARESLVDLFGSLDEFIDATAAFSSDFLSEAERIAPVQAAVSAELDRLGLSAVTSKDAFKELVLGLDLTTQSGAEMFAALLTLGPAFAKVADFATEAAAELASAAAELARAAAAELASAAAELASAAAELARAAVARSGQDVSDAQADLNRARDDLTRSYQSEVAAITDVINRHERLISILGSFREELDSGGLSIASPRDRLSNARTDFNRLAGSQDPDDFANLPAVSRALLEAVRDTAPDALTLARETARVRRAISAAEDSAQGGKSEAEQQLEKLDAQVAGLLEINESVLSVVGAINNLHDATGSVRDAIGELNQNRVVQLAQSGRPTPANDNFDVQAYLARNKDLARNFNAGGTLSRIGADTLEEAARLHYLSTGRFEVALGLRKAFAAGGSFTVGGQRFGDQTDVSFRANAGEVVNVSREDTMAELLVEVGSMRAELAAFRSEQRTVPGDSKKMRDVLVSVTHDGDTLRTTEAA